MAEPVTELELAGWERTIQCQRPLPWIAAKRLIDELRRMRGGRSLNLPVLEDAEPQHFGQAHDA